MGSKVLGWVSLLNKSIETKLSGVETGNDLKIAVGEMLKIESIKKERELVEDPEWKEELLTETRESMRFHAKTYDYRLNFLAGIRNGGL